MRTVTVAWQEENGNKSEEFDFSFGKVFIGCSTPYCKKRIDVVGPHAMNLNETFVEMSVSQNREDLHIKNTYPATCPYCKLETPYSLEMVIYHDRIEFGILSDNIIAIECLTPDGEKKYFLSDGDPTQDPNFNFTENINKGENIYFYDDSDNTGSIQTLDAHFIPEGQSCIAIAHPDETGFSEDYVINGPLAVIEDATLITSNRNKFSCEEVHSADEVLIAPCGSPELFSKKIVVCSKNAPKWTRLRQSSERKHNG